MAKTIVCEGNSLYIFGPQSRFRALVTKLVKA
jgi:voltage-dependent calcium channel T type alpha-1G